MPSRKFSLSPYPFSLLPRTLYPAVFLLSLVSVLNAVPTGTGIDTMSQTTVYLSSVTVSTNTILSGTTFYHGGNAVIGDDANDLVTVPGKLVVGDATVVPTALVFSTGTLRTDNVFNVGGSDGLSFYTCVGESLTFDSESNALTLSRKKLAVTGGVITAFLYDEISCPSVSIGPP